MIGKSPARLKRVKVSLPFGIGEAEWEADDTQRRAAWALYVELVTRIAVQPLPTGEGVLREALGSLHSIFGTTRDVLREFGPDVGSKVPSVGGFAIAVLNKGLRPFLTRWHPRLSAWERRRDPLTDAEWSQAAALRRELVDLQRDLGRYATALAKIAGVSS